MQRALLSRLGVEPIRSALFLSLLIVLKLIMQSLLVAEGIIGVSADEFARGIRAAKWSQQPRFDIVADLQATWLPLEKYLNGSVLILWPDVIWAPRATAFVASCILLVALFLLTYFLFDNFMSAALAACFIVSLPWYGRLSGTPMLDIYFLAAFAGGLVLILAWLQESDRGSWFWAGCCFMIAGGFHVQSWTLINLVNLATIPYLIRYRPQKRVNRIQQLIGFYFLGNGIPIAYSVVAYITGGHPLAFLEKHTTYSKWFYGGYEVSISEKVLYYPELIVRNASPALWVLPAVAVVLLLRKEDERWRLFPLFIAVASLVLSTLLNVLSVPATAAPGRYSLFYLLMLSPYVAYGTVRLFVFAKDRIPDLRAYAAMILAVSLFGYSIYWGWCAWRRFPKACRSRLCVRADI